MARFLIRFVLAIILSLTALTAHAAPVAVAAVMAATETAVAYAAGEIVASAIISSFCTYFMTSLALTAASALLNKKSGGSAMAGAANRTQTIRSPNANRVIVYGRCMVSGPLVYASTTNANQNCNLIIALAAHEIDAIEEIWFDNWKLSLDGGGGIIGATDINGATTDKFNGKGYIHQYLGTETQAADASLMSQDPNWKSTAQLKGIAYLYVCLYYDVNAWSGLPNVKALIRGKKVYDPRNGATAWSPNWALCVRDYLTNSLGLGCSAAEIDDNSVIAAANTADESVIIDSAGHTQPRYQLNGTVDLGNKILDNLNNMITAGAGTVVFQQGQWRVAAGSYSSPIYTLTDDDLRDKITVQARTARKDLYNYITGQFIDPNQGWQPNSFPPITSSQYQTDDGGTIQQDINLPYTTDGIAAQRLAMIFLNKSRYAGTVLFPAKLSAFKVGVWDRIQVTINRLGWVNKIFVVIDWKFTGTGVDLVLQEDDPSCYNWNYGQAAAINYASGTTLPIVGHVSDMQGLMLQAGTAQLQIIGENTLVSRILATWAPVQDAFVSVGGKIEIQYKPSNTTEWINAPSAAGGDTSAYISPVSDDTAYDVRVRAVNSLSNVGNWLTISNFMVVGQTASPSDLANLAINTLNGVANLSWTASQDANVRVGGYIDVRYSPKTSGATWNDGVEIGKFPGNASSGICPLMTGTYLAKAVTGAGKYSTNALDVVTTMASVVNMNLAATLQEDPAFSGTRSNMVVIDNQLKLAGVANIDDQTASVDNWQNIDSLGGVQSSGSYTFHQPLDLGMVYTCRVSAAITAQSLDTNDDIDFRTNNIDDWDSFDGNIVNDVSLQLLISTTNDNPNNNPTWGPWQPFMVGDYTARAFQFKLLITSGSPTHNTSITGLSVTANVPDRVIGANGVTVPTGGLTVTFNQPFMVTPAVGVNINNMASGDYYAITSKSNQGFTIEVFNASGAPVSRVIDWIAKAY